MRSGTLPCSIENELVEIAWLPDLDETDDTEKRNERSQYIWQLWANEVGDGKLRQGIRTPFWMPTRGSHLENNERLQNTIQFLIHDLKCSLYLLKGEGMGRHECWIDALHL
jgi:hypothetical protein